MEDRIKKVIEEMKYDIEQCKYDLDNAFGDESYALAVGSRINCLSQYISKLQSILIEK